MSVKKSQVNIPCFLGAFQGFIYSGQHLIGGHFIVKLQDVPATCPKSPL